MLGSLFSTASVLKFLRPFYFHSFPPVRTRFLCPAGVLNDGARAN